MKPKSIIFILPDLETGGAERIITTIINHLPRELFKPSLLLLRKEGGFLKLLKEDVEIIDIKTQRIRNALLPILREIRRRQPDIVFSGFGEINAYLSGLIGIFPKTTFIARETNVVSRHVTRREIRFFYKFYNNFEKIICQSDDMMRDLQENFGVKTTKLIKINNPVDFDAINQQLEHSDKPASYSDHCKNVVAIGNLSSRKGFDLLLQVFTRLKKENIKLHILGDGRDRKQLLQLKDELKLDNVVFHGRQENPYPFLKFADLFVLSSRYEGFPNVLLEAGACGVYALANQCPGGIKEIIQPGSNGEISDIERAEDFAEKILTLSAARYDREAIKNSIQSRFSKDIIMKKYIDLLSGF